MDLDTVSGEGTSWSSPSTVPHAVIRATGRRATRDAHRVGFFVQDVGLPQALDAMASYVEPPQSR